ncbi:hypothetical protein COO60DRAFT_1656529 [Scenedesmus sp. NREL 46B-D3]|nr:hypothetical protein COO60DRAFT_1656529 [Scenedesmus sp. NREL 46B-D3]
MAALAHSAGHCQVAVTDSARHHDGAGPCTSMTMQQYAAWWEQHHAPLPPPPPPQQQQQQCCRSQTDQQDHDQPPLLYLKDFHFVGNFPHEQVYSTPLYFGEDWLNEYYDAKGQQQQQQAQHDATGQQQQQQQQHAQQQAGGSNLQAGGSAVTSDYRFVYCGPAGSWTPVHADVLRSYSWSANVAGRKRWWLLPPQHTHLFLDRHGQLPADFFQLQGRRPNQLQQQQEQKHPHAHLLLEVAQDAGDVLFVPSGWHHMVINEAPTLSINHNWLNAHNVHWAWALLRSEHQQAAQQLEDCRATAGAEEFEELVQRLLAANSGFSWQDFAELLCTIISRRLQAAQQLQQRQSGQAQQQRAEDQQTAVQQGEAAAEAATLQLQLQTMHCALDLHRAAAVLQQGV